MAATKTLAQTPLTDMAIGVPRGPEEDDLTTLVRLAVHRAARRLRFETQTAADITQSQFCVLVSLEHFGALTPGELAERERVQPPSMTRTVTALAELGYVARAPHPADRRQILVRLTETGQEVVNRVRRRRAVWLAEALNGLEPEQRDALRLAAQLLLQMVER